MENVRVWVCVFIYLLDMQLTYKLIDWILHLMWDKYPKAHHYRIMAMWQTFSYISISATTELKYDFDINKNDNYVCFKIVAESIDSNILCESNDVTIFGDNIEKFKISALNGYYGITLSFRTRVLYDLYKIYNKNILIAETEDPVIGLPNNITKDRLWDILVEWYSKIDGKFVLWGVSDNMVDLPQREKTDYKISVVIPVYNAEVFLPRTLDSILSSSMPDLEVILVDDWSTDKSFDICNWYAKHFSCVSVVQQKNQWVCHARNNGIALAKWKYLGLVDNDDIVHPLMYEKLYNVCETENLDISIATTLIHDSIGSRKFCLDMPWKVEKVLFYTYEQVINNKWNQDNIYFVAVWNKIVKMEVAKNVKFPINYPNNIVLYEDDAYTPTLYSFIDKFAICRDAYYIWDKRKQKTIGTASTMHKWESAEDIWKAYIYACSYPIYNSSEKHKELSDYTSFKHLISKYDKFTEDSSLFSYWNQKLKELINDEKLMDNKYIMEDKHLSDVIKNLV